jgi:alpha-beta hydrolase superfamily lysophospholipase
MNMDNKHDSFVTADGRNMFFQNWSPSGDPEMVIALVHGLGEHSGRYRHWAEKFCGAMIAFAAFDLRGHGLSEGRRGSIPSMDVALSDIGLFLEKVATIFPGIPLVLYGHSLGGNLAVNYVIEMHSNLAGLIITSPWLKLSMPVPGYKMILASLAGSLVPSILQPNGLNPGYLSRDKNMVDQYKSDPHVHDRISAGLFLLASRGGEKALSMAGRISIPVLLMHGTADAITSPEGSKTFSDNSGNNLTIRLWDGFYHELHHEPEKDVVFSFITGWLGKNFG